MRLCKVMKISESGYYKAQRPKRSKDRGREALLAQIYELLHEDIENANYGVMRIYLGLKTRKGYTGSYSTVRRVCAQAGLLLRRKRGAKGITRADPEAQKAENLIQQDFSASAPNEKWLSDITEIPCEDGKLYLAGVLDCYDGQLVGYHMADHMRAELCVEALELACRRYRARGMVVHSDRGSQYTSHAFRAALAAHGAQQSMSGTGRCYDNARMESFWATLKKEKLYRLDTTKTKMASVKSVIIRFICYYNQRRIYTPNGGYPPEVYRSRYSRDQIAA